MEFRICSLLVFAGGLARWLVFLGVPELASAGRAESDRPPRCRRELLREVGVDGEKEMNPDVEVLHENGQTRENAGAQIVRRFASRLRE